MPSQVREAYAFEGFELDLAARSLTKSGSPVSLAPKTFDLLALMVRRPGTLLSKREIIEELWPETFVEEANLSFQVAALRKALGEKSNRWIETVPKHGYRFTAAVNRLSEPVGISTQSSPGVTTGVNRNLWRYAVIALVVAMAVLPAGWVIARRFRRPSPALLMTPLNKYSGYAAEPSLSPDGNRVAFAWDGPSQDNLDIYVKVIGEEPPLRLTSDPRPEYSAEWSSDGRYIAFCREGEVVTVPALGGPERVVVRASADWIPDHRSGCVSWFPDGSALAIVGHPRNAPSSSTPSWRADAGTFDARSGPNGSGSQGLTLIYGVSLANGHSWQLTFSADRMLGDGGPKISPDGRQLAFQRDTVGSNDRQLFSVPLTGDKLTSGEPVRLGADVTFGANGEWIANTGLAWLPNSRTVLFAESGRLWSVPVPSGAPKLLALSGYHPSSLSISRTGRLVFMNESFDLDILRVPGPTNHDISRKNRFPAPFISSTSPDSNPRYSPDGKRITFTSMRGGGLQIWVCNSDGSNPVQLTHFANDNGSPRWSPDGRYIVFDSQEGGQRDIYVVSAEGGPPRRFTFDGAQSVQQMPSWSRDGHWIYFGSNRTGRLELWKAPFPSGAPTQVTQNGGSDGFESPDGKFVYYAKEDQPGIWRQPVGAEREQLVVDHGEPTFWDMYSQGLCLLNREPGPPRVECLDFTTHVLSTIVSLPDDHRIWETGPSFAVSPDGQWVLYSHVESADNGIMSVDNVSEVIR